MIRLHDLTAAVDRREVARLLGYPPGALPRRVAAIVDQVEIEAAQLVRPDGAYTVLDKKRLGASVFLRAIDRVALAVVTIGDGIERAVDDLRRGGRLGAALVYDAWGSAAAEAAADAAEAAIRARIERDDTRCSRRFSPGYGGWDVAEQRWILDALECGDIGIALSEGCMMRPRKSVTFAMTVGLDPVELYDDDLCAACGVHGCEWRDTPERCRRRPVP